MWWVCCAQYSCDDTVYARDIIFLSMANELFNSPSLLIWCLFAVAHILVTTSYLSVGSYGWFSSKHTNLCGRLTGKHSVHINRSICLAQVQIWVEHQWTADTSSQENSSIYYRPFHACIAMKLLNRGSNLCQQTSICIRTFVLDISGFRLRIQRV